MADMPNYLRIENGEIWLNTEKAAEFFSVTPKTLSDWAKRGAPKAARGWWNIKELMVWLGRSPGIDGAGEKSPEARKLAADAEYRELRAAREKLALGALAERLMPIEEIAAEWARRATELKTALLSLSRKVAGQISDPDVRRVVESVIADEVYAFLDQYSRAGKYTPQRTKQKSKKAS